MLIKYLFIFPPIYLFLSLSLSHIHIHADALYSHKCIICLQKLLPRLSILLPLKVRRRICVIMISSIIWEKFRGGTGAREPYLVHFPAYTKETAVAILSADCPSGIDKVFFQQFALLFSNVFHSSCRDLSEMRHLAALLFPRYHDPVLKGEVEPTNNAQLYRRVTPVLRQELRRLYLRTTSSAEWLHLREQREGAGAEGPATQVSLHGDSGHASRAAQGTAPAPSSRRLELPLHTRYLLIAAFLASYNPVRADAQLFSKVSGRQGH